MLHDYSLTSEVPGTLHFLTVVIDCLVPRPRTLGRSQMTSVMGGFAPYPVLV